MRPEPNSQITLFIPVFISKVEEGGFAAVALTVRGVIGLGETPEAAGSSLYEALMAKLTGAHQGCDN